MPQLKRLTNPYRAVFRSYRQRPVFKILALICLAYPDARLGLTVMHSSKFDGNTTSFVIRDVLLYLSDPLYQLGLPIVFAVACMAHLRQQLAGPARMLVPNYRKPHLRVAAFAFFLAALAIPLGPVCAKFFMQLRFADLYFGSIEFGHWVGTYAIAFLVTLTLMTIAAWFAYFVTSWITVVLAPIVFIAMLATQFDPWWTFERWFNDFYREMPRTALSLGYFVFDIALPIVSVGLTLLFNMFALSALWRRLQRITAQRMVEEPSTPHTRADNFNSIPLRQESLTTRWSRIRHLRAAGITLAAPWIVALLLTAILMFIAPLLLNGNRPFMQTQISLILITILPSVAVALLWAERWPRLGVESLLPSTRRQFASDITSAIAIDLLHFWIAIAIASILPLLLIPETPLHAGLLAVWLFASGLMQLLAFAAILWSMWLRSWPTLAFLLCLAMAAMASPLTFSTRDVPLISASTILPLSALIAIIGIALSATSYHRWLRGNWV